MTDPGGDHDDKPILGVRSSHRRTHTGGERLRAEEVDENLTDLLFGEPPPPARPER